MLIELGMGRCISVEPDQVMNQKSFMRMKLEINIASPLVSGFWWSNARGEEKWVSVNYNDYWISAMDVEG